MKRYVNLNRKGSPNSAGAIRSRKLQRKNISVNTNELREIALLNRTKAELWAESIIKERFKNEEFEIEHVFKWRRFDFYFSRIRVDLEIDGGYHNTVSQRKTDLENDLLLYKHFKIKVLRVRNFDMLGLFMMLNQIELMLNEKPVLSDKKIKKLVNKKKNRYQCFKSISKKKTIGPLPFKPRTILRKKNDI